MIRVRLATVAFLLCGPAMAIAAPQGGPNVSARRYDVRLEVLPDGSLDVIETISLAVGAKPITWFERTIPNRRTDGLAGVSGRMDSQAAPSIVERANGVKLRWEFAETRNATRDFEISYRATRVLAREIDGPRLVWTALPREHSYPIDASEITLFAPTGALATYVGAEGGRVLPASAGRDGVVIAGESITDGKAITVDITFAPNSITPVEPRWFVRQEEQMKMLPAWLAAGGALFVVGIGILAMLFARLPRPGGADGDEASAVPASAGSQPPAVAALLISRGQSNAWLALQSAFFRLVRDGRLVVEKADAGRRFRSAAFSVAISDAELPGAAAIAPHEQWILDGLRQAGGRLDLRRLASRYSRRQRGFFSQVMTDALASGLIDAERQRARSGLAVTGFVLMLTGVVGALGVTLFAARLGPAPVVLPGVVFVVGIIYLVMSNAMSLLSQSGVREAARWQARVVELKEIVKSGVSGHSPQDFERWFPLAIGAGIGARWLKAFEPQLAASGAEIRWLRAMGSPADAAASLGVMVAISVASHSGGAGGGAGGAGGGSSGAG